MIKNNFSEKLVEEYAYFEVVYPDYDELQDSLAQSIVGHIDTKDGAGLKLLDIGAGHGPSTIRIANELPKAHFILNDFDADILSKADAALSGYDYEKRVGDIEQVIKEIPDASIDGVYSGWALHNFTPEKRAIVFTEIARILKPNGVFVNLDKIMDAGAERSETLAQTLINFSVIKTQYKRTDLYLEWVKHYIEDEQPDRIFTDDENDKLMRDNSFSAICVRNVLMDKVIVAIKRD